MTRYAFSFGKSRKWYNFYKVEGDKNRFANIDYRWVPSTGLGYWFSDADAWKLMVELGIGSSHTYYLDDKEDLHELILIPRAFGEVKFLGESKLAQEVFVYPSLTESGDYRLHAVTTFTNPITNYLALNVSWTNDYNSAPGTDVKKHDMILATALEYSF